MLNKEEDKLVGFNEKTRILTTKNGR